MKNNTTNQISEMILKTLHGMGYIPDGPVERWEGDGVMHIFIPKVCVEYCGSDNPHFGGSGGSVIITGNPDEDYCIPLRNAGLCPPGEDFIKTFSSMEEMQSIIKMVQPHL